MQLLTARAKKVNRSPMTFWERLYLPAILLGAFFVLFQGYEWVKLIGWGMTLQSGIFGATFFITEGFEFLTDKEHYLTWEQIAELHRDGFEIGNHTRRHAGVPRQPPEQLTADVEFIEQQCAKAGIPRPTSFCYPGYATSDAAVRRLRERKRRPGKALAVLVADLDAARAALISDEEIEGIDIAIADHAAQLSATRSRLLELELDAGGRVVARLGRKGEAPGEFQMPHMLCVDSRGDLYVAEVTNKRIQKFTPRKDAP